MSNEIQLYRRAYLLSLLTIFYNIIEGIVSVFIGYHDETLTLFGFGVDSFIEVLSGVGIAMMVLRIKRNPDSPKGKFEITALKITGVAFYLLSAGLSAGIILNLINQHKPETTFRGVIISMISIVVMFWLYIAKRSVGRRLHSQPILSDANCTKICIYMSLVLLVSSLIYEVTGFGYADTIGAAGLFYFSFSEGRESFDKAKGKSCSCETCDPEFPDYTKVH